MSESTNQVSLTEERFKQIIHDLFTYTIEPRIHEQIRYEVNDQIKRLTATLVSGLIKK